MAETETNVRNKKSEEVRISVRSLVEFIRRSGDIDTRSGSSFDPEAMLAGGRAHRRIQKGMAGDYQAEMSLKDLFDCGDYCIKIEGRADGVFTEKTGTEGVRRFAVDEIKGTYADPDSLREPVPVHLAQAKCYAAIILKQYPAKREDFRELFGIPDGTEMSENEIGVCMTYVHLTENEKIRRFSFIFSREEIFDWYEELIADYKKWTDMQTAWKRKRDLSMEPLSFPFEYRKGQKILVSSVYHTIREKKELFLMAPTGTGKTMAVIYPSVRAIGQGIADRIFYLTAKNQTHRVAEEAFGILKNAGLFMRTVTLTAKEKICPMNEVSCNPDDCPHAKGHFDRINDAVFDLLSEKEVFDRETIADWAAGRNVCPFELGLDLSTWCDAVIGDYNYAFDPNAHLARFFGEGKKSDAILLIDEAHNLVDRAREMYSAELVKEDVLKARNLVKNVSRKAARALSRVNRKMLALRKVFDAEVPDKEPAREVAFAVAGAGDRRAREVERAAVAVEDDLDHRLRGEVCRGLDRRHGGRHRPARVVLQLRGEAFDQLRVDERLVALDVDEDVVVSEVASEEIARGAGDAVCSARELRRRHHGLAAVFLYGFYDALVVCRDEDLVKPLRLLDRLDDPCDEGPARENSEGLARETARPEAGRYYSIDFHAVIIPYMSVRRRTGSRRDRARPRASEC